jgi:predicted hydrocarbon binding protein
MLATMHDLPMRANYFAEDAYWTHDLGKGTIHNRSGARALAVSDDLLVALANTLTAELGEQARVVIASMGEEWGQRAAARFSDEMEKHYGKPLAQLPLALFEASLAEAFRCYGWGTIDVEFDGYAQGLVIVEMRDPPLGAIVRPAAAPVEALVAAFLEGMFSHFAGVRLGCAQTECRACGADASRFVLTIPERIRAIAGSNTAGKSHKWVVEELCRAEMN